MALGAVVGVSALLFAVLITLMVRQAEGHLVYVMDDAYIHMAISKSLATSGTWGINPGEFAGASSSIIWPMLLAALFRVFGAAELWPLILNLCAAGLLLVVGWRTLDAHIRSGGVMFIVLLGLTLVLPLHALAMTGMEHTLQCAFAVAALAGGAGLITADRATPRMRIACAGWVLLLTATRFEGLFIAAPIVLLLMVRRRLMSALVIAGAAGLPVAAYAAYALLHHGTWLPASVLIKANPVAVHSTADVLSLLLYVPRKLMTTDRGLFALLLTCGAAAVFLRISFRGRVAMPSAVRTVESMLYLSMLTILIHAQLARTGMRYEAYLRGMGIISLAAALPHIVRCGGPLAIERFAVCGVCLLAAGTLAIMAVRAVEATRITPTSARNVYEQQYQMGRLLAQWDGPLCVAANDIGAVSYFGHGRVIDLWGLGHMGVFRARRDRSYNLAKIRDITRHEGVQLAMVYDWWFAPFGGLPPEWQLVETWTIENNVACGDATVRFYCTDPAALPLIRARLAAFSNALPPRVRHDVAPIHAADTGVSGR